MSGEPIPVKLDRRIAELFPRFLANCSRDAATLRGAVDTADWAVVSRIGHTLFGLGGGYGLPEITRFGRDIELASKRRDGVQVGKLAAELADYLARLKPVFE